MPELPEVETIRRNLEQTVVGARILSVSDPTHERTLRNQQGGIAGLRAGLEGARLGAAVRRGKFLWFPLARDVPSSEGSLALVIHLGMSGQLRVESGGTAQHSAGSATPAKTVQQRQEEAHSFTHERLRFTLDNGKDLVFCDQRTFGHVELRPLRATADGAPGGTGAPEPLLPQGVEHIARDVLDPSRDTAEFVKKNHASARAIKTKLLDQSIVSGIGNIYADEGLFAARIHPATPGRSLSERKLRELLSAVAEVMEQALHFGGTSFDRLYVNSWGNPGEFAKELQVYGRGGLSCRRCGTRLDKMIIDGRSSVFCPCCQRKR
ncbi:bifunctional DNA-formamidopyrimidine glycosylase/DNA-(apurinic or apyrimidinic site) lyase [uncultured Mobiluncus sp.]|uniref:bifunctional DNA-formamidopyrimidine glycosylase/DNA-(apurinic or apyrimidinic site) lyase n=1 Tax=uncultured Mobiluncus sp. TaxID=293425 RepID=UPI0027D9B8B6|nr:bifunctional DNA-formamidopyrimidine glycosylase/DNA-(apurinic or apyrimidinic site) lyase [uncultured Mobiluncus sp.]